MNRLEELQKKLDRKYASRTGSSKRWNNSIKREINQKFKRASVS